MSLLVIVSNSLFYLGRYDLVILEIKIVFSLQFTCGKMISSISHSSIREADHLE